MKNYFSWEIKNTINPKSLLTTEIKIKPCWFKATVKTYKFKDSKIKEPIVEIWCDNTHQLSLIDVAQLHEELAFHLKNAENTSRKFLEGTL